MRIDGRTDMMTLIVASCNCFETVGRKELVFRPTVSRRDTTTLPQ